MIELVTLAEERLQRGPQDVFVAGAAAAAGRASAASRADPARRLRARRTTRSRARGRASILDFRSGPAILNFVNGAELARYSQAGVVTPDHTIRTKNWPLVVPRAAGRQAR